MRIKEGFVLREVAGQAMVIATGEASKEFHGMVKLNESGKVFEILFVPYRPTAEEMSRHIFNEITKRGVRVTEVELFETPTNSCIYTEED